MINTRFAPSPTGHIHIGNIRTALFAFLFARAKGGKFHVRIEDTDMERSKDEYTQNILQALSWLNIEHDSLSYQSNNAARHTEIVDQLIESGYAYKCYATNEEIEHLRSSGVVRSPWRNPENGLIEPKDTPYVVRFKIDETIEKVTILDQIQGKASVNSLEIEDFILLRSDKSPTYNLAVVIDDHDMNISHIIRGNDHFTNTFKQACIYSALGWNLPEFAHIPLIVNKNGSKLKKRDKATNLNEYIESGYLPEAINNALMRMGWSHGDEEFFTLEEAQQIFTLENCGKSPSQFDIDKLNHYNSYYLKLLDTSEILELLKEFIDNKNHLKLLSTSYEELVKPFADRAPTLKELAKSLDFLFTPIFLDKTQMPEEIRNSVNWKLIHILYHKLQTLDNNEWNTQNIKNLCINTAKEANLSLSDIGIPLRYMICGTKFTPNIFQILACITKETTQTRIEQFLM